MAKQTLIGTWLPSTALNGQAVGSGSFALTASTHKAVLVLVCPKAGSIDRFDFNIASVAQSPASGLRASLQSVDASTGQPSGTILGASNNAKVTYPHTVTTGWKSTTFGESAVVTRGQLIACVIDFPSFAAGDSVTVSQVSPNISSGVPYGVSATSTKQSGIWPVVALHYTDGYVFVSPMLPGANATTSITYNVNTAVADEWGMAFTLPFPATLSAIAWYGSVAAGADYELVVYDSGGTALSTVSVDGDIVGGTGQLQHQIPTQSDLALSAGALYRVAIRPTTTNNVLIRYWGLSDAALFSTLEGGSSLYMTSRVDQAGSWTDYSANSPGARRPMIQLNLTAFDDAATTLPKSRIFTGQ